MQVCLEIIVCYFSLEDYGITHIMYPDFAIVKAVILMSLPVLCLLWISVRMFCTLGLALAMHFEEIATQIDNVSLHLPNLKERLNEWSVAHSLVCNAIRQLEEYFGNVLLLSVCCIFTGSTNFAVFFYDKNKNLGNIRFVVRYFLLLNAICYVAESLKDQVNLPFEIFVKNHQKCIFLFNFVQANKLHLSLLNSPLLQSEDHGAGVTFICKISIR